MRKRITVKDLKESYWSNIEYVHMCNITRLSDSLKSILEGVVHLLLFPILLVRLSLFLPIEAWLNRRSTRKEFE